MVLFLQFASWESTLWLSTCSQLLGYGDTLLSLDKLLENPELAGKNEYVPHNDETMWLRRVDREEARTLLEGQEEGTFLIRPKDNGVHCLSIVWVAAASSPARRIARWRTCVDLPPSGFKTVFMHPWYVYIFNPFTSDPIKALHFAILV